MIKKVCSPTVGLQFAKHALDIVVLNEVLRELGSIASRCSENEPAPDTRERQKSNLLESGQV